jgi:hypothetical protein
MKQTYFRVNDNCETPMVFETFDEALDYLKDCIEGIDFECPVSIEKIEMTSDQFNQLGEL